MWWLFHKFLISVFLSHLKTLPHISPPRYEALVVISQEGGLLSPTMLSLSVSLSLSSPSSEQPNCVCVCVCVFMLLLHFLLLSIFILFQSFSPKYLSPSHSLLFPSFSSHSSSPRRKKTHTIGCHGNWLPWSSKVFMWSLHVCVCVCMSTVAWQSLGVMLIGSRERGNAKQLALNTWPMCKCSHTLDYRKLLIMFPSPRPDQLTPTSRVYVHLKPLEGCAHTLLRRVTVGQWGFVCNYRLHVGL